MRMILKFMLAPGNSGTRVHVQINYKVPIPLLGKLAENMITKQNDVDTGTMMGNIKSNYRIW